MRTFMKQEQSPPAEGVKRSKIGELFYRLLHPNESKNAAQDPGAIATPISPNPIIE